MTIYTAKVTREGKWWMIAIPELDGLTQARRLAEAEQMAREYIALRTDQSIDDVRVYVEVDSIEGIPIAGVLADVREERATAIDLERDASRKVASLAQALANSNIPVRDIGAVLGVSFQRAHQLITTA